MSEDKNACTHDGLHEDAEECAYWKREAQRLIDAGVTEIDPTKPMKVVNSRFTYGERARAEREEKP